MSSLYNQRPKNVTINWPAFLVLLGIIFFSFSSVRAQMGEDISQEAILSYKSNIVVNIDNSTDITEKIIYNTGDTEHHGIYRDIYPYSSQGRKMLVENISVTDEAGTSYQYEVSDSSKNIRIKIGDPNQTFSGQKTYVIKYHATRAVGQVKDFDEIYWNVTGNEWPMPIYQVESFVSLPLGATMTQSACYYGPKGNTEQCILASETKGVYTFESPSALFTGDGLTVAVGFQKGIVTAYALNEGFPGHYDKYIPWLISSVLPILTLLFSLLSWHKKGRDPKGTGVIVPQYDVPEELTPMELVGIASEKVNASHISAEIIYLATKGYLKINQLEEKLLGFIKQTDYELTKLKDSSLLPNDFDKKLLDGLFSDTEQSVKLSDLKNTFYTNIPIITNSVADNLLVKGYYKNLGRMKNGSGRMFIILFMSVWVSGFFGGIIGTVLFNGNPFPLMASMFLSIIIYGIVSHFNPAKTEKGVATKEYIFGLKDYLRVAEKDRLLFHNAPEKKPEVFEKLLPYAMVLGVADIWAKEFEGIYNTPPSWYSGSSGNAFSTIAFNQSLSNFSSFASSDLSSSPSSSSIGSRGGGSSGGGGGGGGGGSW